MAMNRLLSLKENNWTLGACREKMLTLEENFRWHLEAFASKLGISM